MITEEERKLFAKIGKQGGNITKEKYGKNHYKEMAKKRWEKYEKEKEPVDNSEKGARVS